MEYAILIYSEESNLPESWGDEKRREKFYADFGEFNRALNEAGEFVVARRLQTSETATTLRPESAGEIAITDGPFAETKECLAGFFIIDCEDLDHALEWAKKIPSARHGSIEVRPIKTYGGD